MRINSEQRFSESKIADLNVRKSVWTEWRLQAEKGLRELKEYKIRIIKPSLVCNKSYPT